MEGLTSGGDAGADINPTDGGTEGQGGNLTTEGNTEPSWRDGLSDGMKSHSLFQKYTTEEAFLEGVNNLSKLASSKGFERPDENASDEEWASFYTKAGRPEKSSDYSWEAPKVTGEDGSEVPAVNVDPEVLNGLKEEMFNAGLNNQQFQAVMNKFVEADIMDAKAAEAKFEQELSATKEALMQEWGEKFNANIKRVQHVVAKLGLTDVLEEAGVQNNLAIIKMFDGLANRMGEAQLTGESMTSKLSVEAQIKEIRQSDSYMDKTHPDHHTQVKRLDRLYADNY